MRHVTAEGARLVVEDRTTPATAPLELGAFALHLDASDRAQTFAFTFDGGDARLAVASTGTTEPGGACWYMPSPRAVSRT